jgi:hypothetical protein
MMGTLVDQRIFEDLVRTHTPRILSKVRAAVPWSAHYTLCCNAFGSLTT